jgi:hypothetical protein
MNDPSALRAFENDKFSAINDQTSSISQQQRMPRTIVNDIANTTGMPLNKGAEQLISRQQQQKPHNTIYKT